MKTDPFEEKSIQNDVLLHLRNAVKQQPTLVPSGVVRGRLMAAVAAKPQQYTGRARLTATRWAASIGMALLVFTLLWFVVKPGVVLGWTSQGTPPAAYRVYRAPVLGEHRALVGEVKGIQAGEGYHFVDLFVLPAAQYTYTVESVTSNGRTIASQAIAADASQVLLTQVAILAASLLVGWGAMATFSSIGNPLLTNRA